MSAKKNRFKKTVLFGFVVLAFAAGVYFLDFRQEEKTEAQKEQESRILGFQAEQINFLEITHKDEKIALQKSEKGWNILEPIQDKADNDQIEELISAVLDEKKLGLAKETSQLTEADLEEYGLVHPLAVFNIKNNLGQSKRVSVGTQKNFEGHSYLRLDSENKVFVGSTVWYTKAENRLIFYREKRLYRYPLVDVNQVKISSLQDSFELKRKDNNWFSPQHDYVLDQNKVREALRKISEAGVQDYVFDGEPSAILIEEKGLAKRPSVRVEFSTSDAQWTVDINIHEADNAVYALTDRPTRLVKLDPSTWEFFGNLSLDSLRDRTSITRFNLELVKKVLVKIHGKETNFISTNGNWEPARPVGEGEEFGAEQMRAALQRIHDLEISEFIDKKQVDQFKGNDMVILKSESGNLVYQLNWGPEFKMKKNGNEKSYFFARTQVSSSIFALEKEKVEAMGFDQLIKKKDIK